MSSCVVHFFYSITINKEKVLKLIEEIKNYKNLAERKWLLEKSNSLYSKLLEEK